MDKLAITFGFEEEFFLVDAASRDLPVEEAGQYGAKLVAAADALIEESREGLAA